MRFGGPARIGVDQDVGGGKQRQNPRLGLHDNGVGGVQRQSGVQIDMHLHHHDLSGHVGPQAVNARDARISQHRLS